MRNENFINQKGILVILLIKFLSFHLFYFAWQKDYGKMIQVRNNTGTGDKILWPELMLVGKKRLFEKMKANDTIYEFNFIL